MGAVPAVGVLSYTMLHFWCFISLSRGSTFSPKFGRNHERMQQCVRSSNCLLIGASNVRKAKDMRVFACFSMRLSTLALLPAQCVQPRRLSRRITKGHHILACPTSEHMTAIVPMAYFPFLALPPELRIMIYSYFLPTSDGKKPFQLLGKQPFVGLRRTCRIIKHEIDYEALRRSCRLIRRANPNYTLSVGALDMRHMNMVIRNEAEQPRRNFDTLNLSWWEYLPKYSRVDIVYESCGQRSIDDPAFTSICRVIAKPFRRPRIAQSLPAPFCVKFQKPGENLASW